MYVDLCMHLALCVWRVVSEMDGYTNDVAKGREEMVGVCVVSLGAQREAQLCRLGPTAF